MYIIVVYRLLVCLGAVQHDDAHGFHCFNMQLEQYQMIVCKFIAAVQYMHVLRQLRRGFRTIVLHSFMHFVSSSSYLFYALSSLSYMCVYNFTLTAGQLSSIIKFNAQLL